MLINEVCKECNLTKKAIEYYGEQGLINPTVKENGYRYFSDTDVSKLKRISILRGLGLSVSDIRAVLENDGLSTMYDVLNKRELETSSYDVIVNSLAIEKAMIKTKFENLWVLPSNMNVLLFIRL